MIAQRLVGVEESEYSLLVTIIEFYAKAVIQKRSNLWGDVWTTGGSAVSSNHGPQRKLQIESKELESMIEPIILSAN